MKRRSRPDQSRGGAVESPAPSPEGAGPSAARLARRRLLGIWSLSSLVIFVMVGAWSLATPIYAGPDEGAQVVRTVSLMRGELAGPPAPGQSLPTVEARVPQPYAKALSRPRCFMFRPWRNAACAPRFPSGSTRMVKTTTYVGHYPPLYYALVGTPSLFLSPLQAIFAMRLLSDLVMAAAVGLAFALGARPGMPPLLPAATAVSFTPMAIFLGGVVNPSGMEIALSVLCWTAALVVAVGPDRFPSRGLLRILGAASCLLAVTRFASPLWVACIGLVLLALSEGPRLRYLSSNSTAIRWVAAVVAAAAACATWDVATSAFLVGPAGPKATGSTVHVVAQSALYVASLAEEVVGVLGWLDTRPPFVVYVLWIACAVAVIAAGFALGSRRGRTTLAVLAVTAIAIPTAMVASHARRQGLWLLQGRDILPLLVGLPLSAAAITGRRHQKLLEVTGYSMVAVVWGCLLAFFAEALRRYTVGVNGPLDPLKILPGGWHPPLGASVLLATFTLADGAYLILGLTLTRAASRSAPVEKRGGELPAGDEADSDPVAAGAALRQAPPPAGSMWGER